MKSLRMYAQNFHTLAVHVQHQNSSYNVNIPYRHEPVPYQYYQMSRQHRIHFPKYYRNKFRGHQKFRTLIALPAFFFCPTPNSHCMQIHRPEIFCCADMTICQQSGGHLPTIRSAFPRGSYERGGGHVPLHFFKGPKVSFLYKLMLL